MANREKQPPIQLEEEDVQQDGEGQGSISYAGGGDAPSGGKKGFRVPSLGKKGPALGILQIFIPILAAVVISFLLTNTMAVNKGTYSSGMGALQASVDSRIQVEDAKITNVINNYASKSEIAGFLKAGDLGNYAKASDLSGYATTGALAALQAAVGSISSSLTPTQIQALINQGLTGLSTTYIARADLPNLLAGYVPRAELGSLVGGYIPPIVGVGTSYNMTRTSSGYSLTVSSQTGGTYIGRITIVYSSPPWGLDAITNWYDDALFYWAQNTEGSLRTYYPNFRYSADTNEWVFDSLYFYTKGFVLAKGETKTYSVVVDSSIVSLGDGEKAFLEILPGALNTAPVGSDL